jgi:hypothetical protein
MDANTQILRRRFLKVPAKISDSAATLDLRTGDARSEDSILQWMSYLPEDCIKSMIRMGWDITT